MANNQCFTPPITIVDTRKPPPAPLKMSGYETDMQCPRAPKLKAVRRKLEFPDDSFQFFQVDEGSEELARNTEKSQQEQPRSPDIPRNTGFVPPYMQQQLRNHYECKDQQ